MAVFDLKPLSPETIQEMGYSDHDLWMVSIDEDSFGPFEGKSLKHYASENESIFDNAFANRLDDEEAKPFWSHALFQRRAPQMVSQEDSGGTFWILDYGQKQGPYSHRDIDKKIEMGLLSMTDHISTDEGRSWKKLYEISDFDRRSYTSDELPKAPSDSIFQKAKLEVMEKISTPHINTPDELAGMTYQGQHEAKVLTLKLEEMTLKNLQQTEVSGSLKWAIPSVAVIILTLVAAGHYAFSPGGSEELLADVAQESAPQAPRAPNPSRQISRAEIPGGRTPASVGHSAYAPTPTYQAASRFPTHTETHEDARFDEPVDRDPYGNSPEQIEAPPAPEHSLVSNNHNPGEDQSLDAAMNGMDVPTQPVVEEASDF